MYTADVPLCHDVFDAPRRLLRPNYRHMCDNRERELELLGKRRFPSWPAMHLHRHFADPIHLRVHDITGNDRPEA